MTMGPRCTACMRLASLPVVMYCVGADSLTAALAGGEGLPGNRHDPAGGQREPRHV